MSIRGWIVLLILGSGCDEQLAAVPPADGTPQLPAPVVESPSASSVSHVSCVGLSMIMKK